jgi:hypothetical protein
MEKTFLSVVFFDQNPQVNSGKDQRASSFQPKLRPQNLNMVVTGPINPSPKYMKLKLQSSLSDGPRLMMGFLGETHQGQSPKCEAP